MTFAIDDLKQLLEQGQEQVKSLLKERDAQSGEEREKTAKALEKVESRIESLEEKIETAQRAALPGVEVGKHGEKDKFSWARWFKLCLNPKTGERECGYEAEVAREMATRLDGMDASFKTAVNAASDSGGAFLIPTEVQADIVPELEAVSISAQLGVQRIDGLVGNVMWTKDEGGISASYIDTEEEETGAEVVPTFSAIEMRQHTLGVFVPVTFQMMSQPAIALESWLRRRMVAKLALKEDESVFLGTSSGSAPRGVFYVSGAGSINWESLGDGSSDVQFGSGTGTQNVSYGLRAHVKSLANSNALQDATRLGWAMSVEAAFAIANTKDANGLEVFGNGGALPSTLIGYPARTSTQLNYTNAAAAAAGFSATNEFICFGDWARVLNGHWGTLAFAASDETETNFRKARRTLRILSSHDVGVLHSEGFAFSTNFDPASTD